MPEIARHIQVGTRKSPLALAQTRYVCDILAHEKVSYALCEVTTTGDIVQDRPLYDIGGKALFAKELEQNLLKGTIDLAVHSLKDLEFPRPQGLEIVAYLPRADARDVLIVNHPKSQDISTPLDRLHEGSVVGTSSPRRASLLRHYRPDLDVVSLRGNINTRLEKLYDAGQNLDGIVLAKAGLNRLAIKPDDAYSLPYDYFIPAAGQGIIAVEARMEDASVRTLLAPYNDASSALCAQIEQGFIACLENTSCRSPIGVYAHLLENGMTLNAMVEDDAGRVTFFCKNYDEVPTPKGAIADLMHYFG